MSQDEATTSYGSVTTPAIDPLRHFVVMKKFAHFRSNADIQNISEPAIDTCIRTALTKLNTTNKTHAVAKCVYLGIVDL